MAIEETNTFARYAMHKYWGKKPAKGIHHLINEFTKEGDVILDPFAGYGVFCCEAYLSGRSVIVNDLNPIANFISATVMDQTVDLNLVKRAWDRIEKELSPYVDNWYRIEIGGNSYIAQSILRDNSGLPIKFSYKEGRSTKTLDIPTDVAEKFISVENEYVINDWFPDDLLIPNSRISAQEGMRVSDLFTKRTLACHARLLALINKYSTGKERDLLLLAFSANLANCSKLVPPIKSRGDIAQGAWMTGFYIANNYIENNVLHYYTNRLNKAIRGKEEYLRIVEPKDNLFASKQPDKSVDYSITRYDARDLKIDDNSVDYVFTDPPYGDSVPYFEQSALWNSWLQLIPDYDSEIVISDSRSRKKSLCQFETDIHKAISEIYRVLKPEKYFSITFHSLSGLEWKALSNACVKNNFQVVKYEWLEQKTYPPRQLNRLKTIKGDVLVTFIKKELLPQPYRKTDEQLRNELMNFIEVTLLIGPRDTNSLMMDIMEWVLRSRFVIDNLDIFEVLNKHFKITEDGMWVI